MATKAIHIHSQMGRGLAWVTARSTHKLIIEFVQLRFLLWGKAGNRPE